MDRWETRTTTRSGRNWAPMGGSITDKDWELFVSDLAAGASEFEISDACLYSTQTVKPGQTGFLTFFQDAWGPNTTRVKTGMMLPANLPMPQSFLITTVRIFGLPGSMLLTSFQLHLGNKEYIRRPSWLCAIRRGSVLSPRMYIPPMVNFCARIEWDGEFQLGKDINGRPAKQREIQVAFTGRIARPVQ